MNNLAHEYASCSAYYTMAAKSLDIENLPERKGAYDKLIDASKTAFSYSTLLTDEELAASRVRLEMNDITKSLGSSYSRFSIVIEKYSEKCGELLAQAEQKFQQLLKGE